MTNLSISESTPDDITRNYQNSFLLLRKKDTSVIPIFIRDINHSNGMFVYSTGGKDTMKSISYNDENIITDLPDLGMTYYSGKYFYLTRVAARQWNRGYRSRYVHCFQLFPAYIQEHSVDSIVIVEGMNFSVGNTTHPHILDRDWAVVGKTMYFRSIAIGKVVGTNKVETPFNLLTHPQNWEVIRV